MKSFLLQTLNKGGYTPLSTYDDVAESTEDRPTKSRSTLTATLTILALCISLIANAVLGARTMFHSDQRLYREVIDNDRSPYAKLTRNLPVAIEHGTEYSSHNLTHVRQLWEDISIDDGMIALPDSVAEHDGLPEAQRFPWDHEKGIYFLNGYHNLHCLRSVHIALMEFHFGDPQSRNFNHVLHCMDALRQDIICNADDTPRYTTITKEPSSGVGQVRMCRDWSQLEQWSRSYNACYKFVNQTATGFPQVLRYTYCPPDSPYVQQITDIFSKAGRLHETGIDQSQED